MFDVRCFVIPAAILDGWESLAQQLLVLIQAEPKHASRQLYLCGESFGACVALTAMAKAPALFDRIILINSASSFHHVPLLTLGSFLLPWTPQCLYDVSSMLAVPLLAQVTRLSLIACQTLMKATQAAPKRTTEQRLELLRNFRIDEADHEFDQTSWLCSIVESWCCL